MTKGKTDKSCNLCGKPMGEELGENHKSCEDYEATMADRK